jgi:hypothetical protein
MEMFTFDGEDLKRNIVGLIHTPASVRRGNQEIPLQGKKQSGGFTA